MSGKRRLPDSSLLNVSMLDDDDEPIRSPRTPTYIPSSPSLSGLSPFDPSKRFSFTFSPTPPSQIGSVHAKKKAKALPPPPPIPLSWIWQCHLCHSRWHLGTTRRCLLDGHYYCSGENSQPNMKKKKKQQSCSSEFDYVGWKQWTDWKRKVDRLSDDSKPLKGCESCEFPSQCRYTKVARQEIARSTTGLAGNDLADAVTTSSQPSEYESENIDLEQDLSRYYSGPTSAPSLENLVLAAIKDRNEHKQSKVTDFHKPDQTTLPGSGSSIGEMILEKVKSKNSAAASSGGHSPTSRSLSEGLQELVLPVIDYWSGDKKPK